MKDKCKCSNDCCDFCLDDIIEDDDYMIQRLEDIIEICQFLIKVRKHQAEKQNFFSEMLEDDESEDDESEDDEPENDSDIYKYLKNPSYYGIRKMRIPPWELFWF